MECILSTDKLILTTPQLSDAAELFQLRTNPSVNQYIERKIPEHISEVEYFISQRIADQCDYYFVIKNKLDNRLIGAACLKNIDSTIQYAEVGYELLPEFQGKGYMQNALEKILFFAFIDLELTTIEAFTHRENLKSRSLLERNKLRL